jgi:Glucan phosphorylase
MDFKLKKADDWSKYGDPWSLRKYEDSVLVKFSDQNVIAVPYDIPIIGYKGNNISTLRLWQAEPVNEFDFNLFNDQNYDLAVKEKNKAEDISRVLYPNDDTLDRKKIKI